MPENPGASVPIYTLRGSAETVVPGDLAITVTSVTAPDAAAVRLEVVTADGTPEPVARPRPGLLVIPPVRRRLVLRAVPMAEPTFPSDTRTELSLAVGQARQTGAALVRLSRTDLSGLPFRDLVTIDPRPAGTAISATRERVDRTLPALGTMARTAARAVLGTEALPAERAVDVRVGLDISASMSVVAPADSLAAVVDLLIGIAAVVSPDRPPEVAAIGVERSALPAESGQEPGAGYAGQLRSLPSSTGLLSSAALGDGRPATRPALTYLVTDGLPADLSTDPDRRPHLVVLTSASAWRVATNGNDVAATVIDLPVDHRAMTTTLLESPLVVRAIVGSLLESLPAPVTS